MYKGQHIGGYICIKDNMDIYTHVQGAACTRGYMYKGLHVQGATCIMHLDPVTETVSVE